MGDDLRDLIDLVKDDTAFSKEYRRFADVCSGAKELVPLLIQQLKNEEQHVRRNTAIALREMGSEARVAIPDLVQMATNPSETTYVRTVALASLRVLGGLPLIADLIKDFEPEVKVAAIRQAGYATPPNGTLIPPLIDALKDENVRSEAASALKRIGPMVASFVEATLHDEDPLVSIAAAGILIAIDSGNLSAIETATRLLKESVRVEVRKGAASALWDYAGCQPQLTVADYKRLLRDESEWVRTFAVLALRKIGVPKTLEAFDALQEALNDPDPDVKSFSTETLGDMGPHAKSLVPRFIQMARGWSVEAVRALGNIGPGAEEALSPLRALLDDIGAIDTEERAADPTTSSLEDAIRNAILQIRGEPARIITVPMAKASISELVESLKDENLATTVAAGDELVRRGEKAVPELVNALSGGSTDLRVRIITALRELGPKAAFAVPGLVAGLADREVYFSESVGSLCALALTRIGAAAIPALQEAAKSSDPTVRVLALRTIKRIHA